MKKFLLLVLISVLTISCANATAKNSRTNAKTCSQPQVSQTYTNFYNQRASVYNALNLTDEQMKDPSYLLSKGFTCFSISDETIK